MKMVLREVLFTINKEILIVFPFRRSFTYPVISLLKSSLDL